MTIIGTFKPVGDGYAGEVNTISIALKDVRLVRRDKPEGSKSPDYSVRYAKAEIGAGWKRTSKNDRPYVSIRFDDPALSRPLNCRLIQVDENALALIWDRPRPKKK